MGWAHLQGRPASRRPSGPRALHTPTLHPKAETAEWERKRATSVAGRRDETTGGAVPAPVSPLRLSGTSCCAATNTTRHTHNTHGPNRRWEGTRVSCFTPSVLSSGAAHTTRTTSSTPPHHTHPRTHTY